MSRRIRLDPAQYDRWIDAEYSGDGGELIYAADVAELARLVQARGKSAR